MSYRDPDVIEIDVPGMQGAPGESAYDIAVANGFTGTQAQWLASLRGVGGSGSRYDFPTPTTQWVITHNLGHAPSVAVEVGNEQVWADVSHSVDRNTSYVSFGVPSSGTAVLG